jgi:hypothetical protein
MRRPLRYVSFLTLKATKLKASLAKYFPTLQYGEELRSTSTGSFPRNSKDTFSLHAQQLQLPFDRLALATTT